ncbi:traB domain-containing protein-like protein [Anopheles sinensis]|uniref:TraB domain-containing protein-like protein n=1 Tax=Anopheles sinensis TaxID=74873 RepID=A0A084WA42_ANOSI|nr:traB domain-containing protein-like protein [Anopheles sinensis]
MAARFCKCRSRHILWKQQKQIDGTFAHFSDVIVASDEVLHCHELCMTACASRSGSDRNGAVRWG